MKLFILKIAIGIICIISIYFVLDAYVFHPQTPPIAVVVSNVSATSATVTYVTIKPTTSCVLVYRLQSFFFKPFCEKDSTRVHNITVSELRLESSYQLLIGKGMQWTNKKIDPVNGRLQDQAYIPTILPSIETVKTQMIDSLELAVAPILMGIVVDAKETPQSNAVLIINDLKTNRRFSTSTNGAGLFIISLVGIKPVDEVVMTVWATNGYIKLPQPISLHAGVVQTVKVVAYE